MDCGACCGGGLFVEALPAAVKLGSGYRRDAGKFGVGPRCVAVNSQVSTQFRNTHVFGNPKGSHFIVKAANAESNKCEHKNFGSPLEPQSSTGKFLKCILSNQPNIFHVAAAKELEVLASDRDSAAARSMHSLNSSETCLHRRIAEMKEIECQFAVEEVMYMLIVQNFSNIKVPMVPRLSKFIKGQTFDIWPSKDKELESIHCIEILDLIKEHLLNIFGRQGRLGSSGNLPTAEIKRLQLGRLYAAFIIYGYFLKSAWLRHRLEHSLARTDADYPLGCTICVPHLDRQLSNLEEHLTVTGRPFDVVSMLSPAIARSRKPKRLRNYVMDFDPKAVQLCANLRSLEAANIIEKHCLAIFGDGKTDEAGDDSAIGVTFSGLKRLMLEAVAFGTFLWDAERYVDSIYRLKENQLGVRQ